MSEKTNSMPTRRRGAVTVEFTLMITLFLTLCFAAIEFARFNVVLHVVDNAAYEAARVGILPGKTVTDIQTQATQYLTNAGTQGATITVAPDPISDLTEEVTVTVSVPMDQNTWVTPVFTPGATIQKSSTLRTERYRGIQTP